MRLSPTAHRTRTTREEARQPQCLRPARWHGLLLSPDTDKNTPNPYPTVDNLFADLDNLYAAVDPKSEATMKLFDGELNQGDKEGFKA